MDTQQVQQQMRVRRAAIDTRLDLLARGTAAARRRGIPAAVAMAAVMVALTAWTWRARRRRQVG